MYRSRSANERRGSISDVPRETAASIGCYVAPRSGRNLKDGASRLRVALSKRFTFGNKPRSNGGTLGVCFGCIFNENIPTDVEELLGGWLLWKL